MSAGVADPEQVAGDDRLQRVPTNGVTPANIS
jgi:hypothetical protein